MRLMNVMDTAAGSRRHADEHFDPAVVIGQVGYIDGRVLPPQHDFDAFAQLAAHAFLGGAEREQNGDDDE